MMKNKISFLGLFYSVLFLSSFYQSKEFTDPFIVPKNFYLAFTGLVVIIFPLAHYFIKKYRQTITLTLIDVSVLAYFSYLTLNLLLKGGQPFLDFRWMNLSICVIIYLLYSSFFKPGHGLNKSNLLLRTIVLVLILTGIIQSIFGLGQYFGIFKNIQSEFNITGAFGNPGTYANFLIAILPFSLTIAIFYNKGVFKYLALVSSVLILITLPFTAARTAWIAAALLIAYVLMHTTYFVKLWQKYFSSLRKKILLFSIISIVFITGVFALTKFKEESASGRLFIWKVSMQMIKDKPIIGHGHASFPVVHNNYQAQYFRDNPEDWDNAFLADGINYAFNEYIQIASEIGIPGLLLFLLIPYSVYRKKRLHNISNDSIFIVAAEGAVLSILVSSLFSYPLQDVSVPLVLFFSLGILSANSSSTKFSFGLQPKLRKLFIVCAFILGIIFFKAEITRFNAEKEWLKAFHLVRKGKYAQAQKKYEDVYDKLQYNQFFLFNYGAELTVMEKYPKSIEVLEEVGNRLNDSDYYIYLGSSYEGVGDYFNALQCFEQASFIMPVKFYPRYRMVLLYRKIGDMDNARIQAKKIVALPVKVESDIVTNIKAEMKQFLENQGKGF